MKTWIATTAVLLAFSGFEADGKMRQPDAVVRVFVRTSRVPIPGVVMSTGEMEAARLFRELGIRLDWTLDGGKDNEPASGAIEITFQPHAPQGFATPERQKALAFAQPYSRDPALITVFGDRVIACLSRYDQNQAGRVLGYILAHEIAHVLEGESRHSETGVMKAEWNQEEFRLMTVSGLTFALEDRNMIRRALQ